MPKFDIVIPTLDSLRASEVVDDMKRYAYFDHNYIIVDNGYSPKGYVEPCNRGYKAGNSEVVAFVNDDIETGMHWDYDLVEEASKGTYCFYPSCQVEENMRLNGWFFCLRRDYIEAYGWAFDPRFVIWCGDVDLIRRLEEDHIEPVLVDGPDISHEFSQTTVRPDLQQWIIPLQLRDLELYREKWGTDANDDKVRR